MSTAVWPFTMRRPYDERAIFNTTREGLANGYELRRAELGVYGQMRVAGRIMLPYGGQTAADLHSFLVAREGGADTFLYKCLHTRHRTSTAEALGTGDGSTVAFALDFRHVDASTLLVYKDGVLQTLTTHYTFGGNNSAPTVTFVAAPAGGLAITATYDYYYPVTLIEGGDSGSFENLHLTGSDATTIVRHAVVMLEEYPGAHRA